MDVSTISSPLPLSLIRTCIHQHGPKEGKELTDYEAGIRSGYLQCQSDHSGLYKYKKALDEGKTKEEAAAISRKRAKREEREAAKAAKAEAKAEAKAAKAEAKAQRTAAKNDAAE